MCLQSSNIARMIFLYSAGMLATNVDKKHRNIIGGKKMLTLYRRPRFRRNFHYYRPVNFNGGRRLPVDFHADENEFVVTAEIAGLDPEDLQIEIKDDILTVKGEVKSETNGDGEYLLKEIFHGEFSRSLRLPEAVEIDKVEAKVENGLLMINLPKAEEARPKAIKINTK
jgi:HSP20 family protein